ncbi:Ger(x)C family spore germination protein [Paenibacillus agricola]|uniref:Ger(X)C family spore germination protein n=1 Tax=Paenibacillus agricola TaxID=2716264 RepID=A0ABX0J799_9BACL|nr:Ger(x)C family spore germination protein [Paenibacillus agricola]NHN31488.1 Ger(x)C family spore germination protein [Paenibacillus agricola]
MKRFIRIGLVSLVIAFSLLLNGCGDLNEINELAIVDMIGVDQEEDGTYMAYYQVVNPNGVAGSKSGGTRSPIYTYEFKGKTWAEFTDTATKTIPRRLFISHFQAYIVSERLAKKGLGDLMNFLENDPSRRMATSVFITKNPVRDVMNTYVPLEMNPGKELRSIQQLQIEVTGKADKDSQFNAIIKNYKTSQLTFVSNISLSGLEPFSTTKRFETIEGNRGNFQYTGVSIIKQGRWLGELKATQIAPLLFILGKNKSLMESLVLGKNESAQVQLDEKPKIENKLVINGQDTSLHITIKPKLKLIAINQKERLDSTTLHRLEKMFDKQMTDHAKDLLNIGRQHDWDLLGVEEQINHKSGKAWAPLKADSNSWKNTEVTIDIHSTIVKMGVLLTPY